ncbi:hypothetical protein AAY473_024952 [Plecturocebus cupreus]
MPVIPATQEAEVGESLEPRSPWHQPDSSLVAFKQRKLCDLGQDTDPLQTLRRSDIQNAVRTALGCSGLFPRPVAAPGQGSGRSGSPAAGTGGVGEMFRTDMARPKNCSASPARGPGPPGSSRSLDPPEWRSGRALGAGHAGALSSPGFPELGRLDLADREKSGAAPAAGPWTASFRRAGAGRGLAGSPRARSSAGPRPPPTAACLPAPRPGR